MLKYYGHDWRNSQCISHVFLIINISFLTRYGISKDRRGQTLIRRPVYWLGLNIFNEISEVEVQKITLITSFSSFWSILINTTHSLP